MNTNSNINQTKYLKYKKKYISLKKQIGGKCDPLPKEDDRDIISSENLKNLQPYEIITIQNVCYKVTNLYNWIFNMGNNDLPTNNPTNNIINYHERCKLKEAYIRVLQLSQSITTKTSEKKQEQKKENNIAIRIVSYNILSDDLCDFNKYPTAPRGDAQLAIETRIALVQTRLEAEILDAGIIPVVIGLQEVSVRIASLLHPFFIQRGYTLICVHNDGPNNGWMGCALAIPLASFDVLETDIDIIARIKSTGYNLNSRSGVPDINDSPTQHPLCEYRLAQSFPQNFIGARLRLKGTDSENSFWCYVTHLPCMYKCNRDIRAQAIQAALISRHVQEHANGKAYILLGDFNAKPTPGVDGVYKLMTEGCIPSEHIHHPTAWPEFGHHERMRSVYAVALGHEPLFTTYVVKSKTDIVFCEVLDYIFISHHWHVDKVLELPTETIEVATSKSNMNLTPDKRRAFPMNMEPSDHLMLATTLVL